MPTQHAPKNLKVSRNQFLAKAMKGAQGDVFWHCQEMQIQKWRNIKIEDFHNFHTIQRSWRHQKSQAQHFEVLNASKCLGAPFQGLGGVKRLKHTCESSWPRVHLFELLKMQNSVEMRLLHLRKKLKKIQGPSVWAHLRTILTSWPSVHHFCILKMQDNVEIRLVYLIKKFEKISMS